MADSVTGISEDGVHLGSRKVSARWIIGADGGNSRVRRWTGLDASASGIAATRFGGIIAWRHGPIAWNSMGAARRNLRHADLERSGLRRADFS